MRRLKPLIFGLCAIALQGCGDGMVSTWDQQTVSVRVAATDAQPETSFSIGVVSEYEGEFGICIQADKDRWRELFEERGSPVVVAAEDGVAWSLELLPSDEASNSWQGHGCQLIN